MSSKKAGSVGGFGNTRPSSAKGTRNTSKGKLSSRSNVSTASELSDLSITGSQKKVAKKTEQHRTDVRSSLSGRPVCDATGSDSDRTSSSTGARNKTANLNQDGNSRYSDSKSSSLGKSRSKHKKDIALVFKNKPSTPDSSSKPRYVPSTDDIDDWWPGSNHVPKVPPLHDLSSPSEDKELNWWDKINDSQPNSAVAQNHWPKISQDNDPLVDALNEMLNSPIQEQSKEGIKVAEDESKESPVPKLTFSSSMDDESSCEKHSAAVIIQKWYRGWSVRRKTGKSAVKHLLGQTKLYKERQSLDYLGSMEAKEAERVKRREEKARLARQAAIKELQNKREEKKMENQRKAEEEIVFLQSSGVISKKKSNTKPKLKPTATKRKNSKTELNNSSCASAAVDNKGEDKRPSTGNSTARKLDEIFKQDTRTSQVVKSVADTEEALQTDRTEGTLQNVSETTSKSTFEDLLQSLKQLEQEPEKPLTSDNGPKYGGWIEQLTARIDDVSQQPYLSAENLGHLNQHKIETETGVALSEEKLKTIMNFLDEVEKAEEIALSEIHQSREEAISRGLTSPSANTNETAQKEREEARAEMTRKEMAALESVSASAADVTNTMMAMKIELEEKKRTNELLQRALNQQRDFTLRQGKESEKDSKQRLAIQKQEYEAAIQRHLTFIDQLIDDKKILGERCEELLSKLKTVDKKYTDKIKTLEDNHAVEVKKQKDVIMAAEKLRREKWIAEKTQQIKEVTVKGLEPDIQKLIAKHKAEIKKLRSSHQAELLEADERAGRRYIQQIEELREQLEREKDIACMKERELAQQRLEKQMEQEEQAYQQQRRRLYSELQEEKERLAAQAQRQRQEMDAFRVELQESEKTVVAEIQRSHEKAMADTESKHQFEIKDLKERLEIEKQAWIENYMKKQDAILLTKERELKEGVREARDREIEMVITRLEEETAASREECERAAENRIKRIRNKYESEIKELEKSESNMQQKYNTLKERLLEVEGEVSRLRSQNKQVTQQKEDVDKVLSKLQEERGKVADIIRQEFADRLVTTEEDNKRLKNDVSEMRARHRLEMDRITREKEQEMEQLHQRVKQAIARKEETVKALQEQQQAAMKRADHLEMLLQQQRKKLLP